MRISCARAIVIIDVKYVCKRPCSSGNGRYRVPGSGTGERPVGLLYLFAAEIKDMPGGELIPKSTCIYIEAWAEVPAAAYVRGNQELSETADDGHIRALAGFGVRTLPGRADLNFAERRRPG
jgi:hypothetical protein